MSNYEGGWRGLIRRSPNWVIALAIAVLYTALTLGMDLLKGDGFEPVKVTINAAGGFFLGWFALWINRWRQARDRKKSEGSVTTPRLQQAVSIGRLPEHASADQWVPELQKIARQERHWVWGGPLFFGIFAAGGVFLIVDDPDHPWYGVFISACFLSAAIWYPIWIKRRRARINGLIAGLERNPPAPPP